MYKFHSKKLKSVVLSILILFGIGNGAIDAYGAEASLAKTTFYVY